MKQLIDLLRQLALSAPLSGTARTAQEAADRLFRGIVAASSALPQAEGPDEPDELEVDAAAFETSVGDGRSPEQP
jgi:hypothetical protein